MTRSLKFLALIALSSALSGCSGLWRGFSSWQAENFSSDWIIVQNDYEMIPKMCWRLANTSVTNENGTDGIYWLDPHEAHLVHISGWYNRVQVANGDWGGAAERLGVDLNRCRNGRYEKD